MSKFLNYISTFLVGLSLLITTLQASEDFDLNYSSEVVSSRSRMFEPLHNKRNLWEVLYHVKFDNGLHAIHYTEFLNAYDADMYEFKKLPHGKANIVLNELEMHSYNYSLFDLVFEDYNLLEEAILAIDEDYDFSSNPRMSSFSINEQVKRGWLFDTYHYQYLIELDNGSVWASNWMDSRMGESEKEEWNEAPVVVIGNSKSVCLIKAKKTKYAKISYPEVLPNLQQIR